MNAHTPPPAAPISSRRLRHVTQLLSQDNAFIYMCFSEEDAGLFNRRNGISTLATKITKGEVGTLLAKGLVVEYARSARGVRYSRTPKSERRGQTAADRRRARFMEAERFFQNTPDAAPNTVTVNLGESPLGWLARRRNANGDPFLLPEEIEAGETLRADFERAQLGPRVTQDWRSFLTPGGSGSGVSAQERGVDDGAEAARHRVMNALSDLGPGLSDAALRTCCFLEGLETVEATMAWSARSGKIVLKIALQRLAEHYRRMEPRSKHGEIRTWQSPAS